jgi:hypothetical protein
MANRSSDQRLSVVVNEATGIVAVQADCCIIEAFDRLTIRADSIGQTLEHTALDVIDHVLRFDV